MNNSKHPKTKIQEMHRLTPEEYDGSAKTPLVVVLDHVRSLHNVGSVFRTSDAFRLCGVCLCGITATPPNAEIHKTALGAEDTVRWRYYSNTQDAVRELKQEGYEVLAVEQCHGSVMLQDFRPGKGRRYAVVLGNEVKGVQQEVVDLCDHCIEIPQFGTKHSMNVSVTAGIVIWHFARTLLLE
ncbi:MAG: RNA methyltransferase [Bacteroidaceae bacterium]|nr:RNA methyltransferase [Bacteroidaceae bacterium]